MVPRRRKRAFWIVAAAVVVAIIVVSGSVFLAPVYRSTDHFVALPADPRVQHERGAEAMAEVVARALPDAIATVERAQGGAFRKPVRVFVCASTESFERYRVGGAGAGGFVLNNRLFISPKPQNTAGRLPALLTHELSHLHFEQHLGMLRFARRIPAWFREGIAVHISNAGAETVAEDEARRALAEGRRFRLALRGSLFEQSETRAGLKPHLFYRQSALFVGFMARQDPGAFRRLVSSLQAGERFAPAVQAAYGSDVPALWERFLVENRRSIQRA